MLTKTKKRYLFSAIVFLFLLLSTAVGFFLLKNSQDNRQQASGGNCLPGAPYCNGSTPTPSPAAGSVPNDKGIVSTTYTGNRPTSQGGCGGVWMNSFCYMPGDELAGGKVIIASGRYNFPYIEDKKVYESANFGAETVSKVVGSIESLGKECGGQGVAVGNTCYAYGAVVNGFLVVPPRSSGCSNTAGDYCYAHLEKIDVSYNDWQTAVSSYEKNGDIRALEDLYKKTYGVSFSAGSLYDPTAANANLLKAQSILSALTSASVLQEQAKAQNTELSKKGQLTTQEKALFDFNLQVINDPNLATRYQTLDQLNDSTAQQLSYSSAVNGMYADLVKAGSDAEMGKIAVEQFKAIFGYDPGTKFGNVNGILGALGIDTSRLNADRTSLAAESANGGVNASDPKIEQLNEEYKKYATGASEDIADLRQAMIAAGLTSTAEASKLSEQALLELFLTAATGESAEQVKETATGLVDARVSAQKEQQLIEDYLENIDRVGQDKGERDDIADLSLSYLTSLYELQNDGKVPPTSTGKDWLEKEISKDNAQFALSMYAATQDAGHLQNYYISNSTGPIGSGASVPSDEKALLTAIYGEEIANEVYRSAILPTRFQDAVASFALDGGDSLRKVCSDVGLANCDITQDNAVDALDEITTALYSGKTDSQGQPFNIPQMTTDLANKINLNSKEVENKTWWELALAGSSLSSTPAAKCVYTDIECVQNYMDDLNADPNSVTNRYQIAFDASQVFDEFQTYSYAKEYQNQIDDYTFGLAYGNALMNDGANGNKNFSTGTTGNNALGLSTVQSIGLGYNQFITQNMGVDNTVTDIGSTYATAKRDDYTGPANTFVSNIAMVGAENLNLVDSYQGASVGFYVDKSFSNAAAEIGSAVTYATTYRNTVLEDVFSGNLTFSNNDPAEAAAQASAVYEADYEEEALKGFYDEHVANAAAEGKPTDFASFEEFMTDPEIKRSAEALHYETLSNVVAPAAAIVTLPVAMWYGAATPVILGLASSEFSLYQGAGMKAQALELQRYDIETKKNALILSYEESGMSDVDVEAEKAKLQTQVDTLNSQGNMMLANSAVAAVTSAGGWVGGLAQAAGNTTGVLATTGQILTKAGQVSGIGLNSYNSYAAGKEAINQYAAGNVAEGNWSALTSFIAATGTLGNSFGVVGGNKITNVIDLFGDATSGVAGTVVDMRQVSAACGNSSDAFTQKDCTNAVIGLALSAGQNVSQVSASTRNYNQDVSTTKLEDFKNQVGAVEAELLKLTGASPDSQEVLTINILKTHLDSLNGSIANLTKANSNLAISAPLNNFKTANESVAAGLRAQIDGITKASQTAEAEFNAKIDKITEAGPVTATDAETINKLQESEVARKTAEADQLARLNDQLEAFTKQPQEVLDLNSKIQEIDNEIAKKGLLMSEVDYEEALNKRSLLVSELETKTSALSVADSVKKQAENLLADIAANQARLQSDRIRLSANDLKARDLIKQYTPEEELSKYRAERELDLAATKLEDDPAKRMLSVAALEADLADIVRLEVERRAVSAESLNGYNAEQAGRRIENLTRDIEALKAKPIPDADDAEKIAKLQLDRNETQVALDKLTAIEAEISNSKARVETTLPENKSLLRRIADAINPFGRKTRQAYEKSLSLIAKQNELQAAYDKVSDDPSGGYAKQLKTELESVQRQLLEQKMILAQAAVPKQGFVAGLIDRFLPSAEVRAERVSIADLKTLASKLGDKNLKLAEQIKAKMAEITAKMAEIEALQKATPIDDAAIKAKESELADLHKVRNDLLETANSSMRGSEALIKINRGGPEDFTKYEVTGKGKNLGLNNDQLRLLNNELEAFEKFRRSSQTPDQIEKFGLFKIYSETGSFKDQDVFLLAEIEAFGVGRRGTVFGALPGMGKTDLVMPFNVLLKQRLTGDSQFVVFPEAKLMKPWTIDDNYTANGTFIRYVEDRFGVGSVVIIKPNDTAIDPAVLAKAKFVITTKDVAFDLQSTGTQIGAVLRNKWRASYVHADEVDWTFNPNENYKLSGNQVALKSKAEYELYVAAQLRMLGVDENGSLTTGGLPAIRKLIDSVMANGAIPEGIVRTADGNNGKFANTTEGQDLERQVLGEWLDTWGGRGKIPGLNLSGDLADVRNKINLYLTTGTGDEIHPLRAEMAMVNEAVNLLAKVPNENYGLTTNKDGISSIAPNEQNRVTGRSYSAVAESLIYNTLGARILGVNLGEIDLGKITVGEGGSEINYALLMLESKGFSLYTGTPETVAKFYKMAYGIDLKAFSASAIDDTMARFNAPPTGTDSKIFTAVMAQIADRIGEGKNQVYVNMATGLESNDVAFGNLVRSFRSIDSQEAYQKFVRIGANGELEVYEIQSLGVMKMTEKFATTDELNAYTSTLDKANGGLGERYVKFYDYGAHVGVDTANNVAFSRAVGICNGCDETTFAQGINRIRVQVGATDPTTGRAKVDYAPIDIVWLDAPAGRTPAVADFQLSIKGKQAINEAIAEVSFKETLLKNSVDDTFADLIDLVKNGKKGGFLGFGSYKANDDLLAKLETARQKWKETSGMNYTLGADDMTAQAKLEKTAGQVAGVYDELNKILVGSGEPAKLLAQRADGAVGNGAVKLAFSSDDGYETLGEKPSYRQIVDLINKSSLHLGAVDVAFTNRSSPADVIQREIATAIKNSQNKPGNDPGNSDPNAAPKNGGPIIPGGGGSSGGAKTVANRGTIGAAFSTFSSAVSNLWNGSVDEKKLLEEHKAEVEAKKAALLAAYKAEADALKVERDAGVTPVRAEEIVNRLLEVDVSDDDVNVQKEAEQAVVASLAEDYRSPGIKNGSAKTGGFSVSIDQVSKTISAVKNSKFVAQLPEVLAEFIDAINLVPDDGSTQPIASPEDDAAFVVANQAEVAAAEEKLQIEVDAAIEENNKQIALIQNSRRMVRAKLSTPLIRKDRAATKALNDQIKTYDEQEADLKEKLRLIEERDLTAEAILLVREEIAAQQGNKSFLSMARSFVADSLSEWWANVGKQKTSPVTNVNNDPATTRTVKQEVSGFADFKVYFINFSALWSGALDENKLAILVDQKKEQLRAQYEAEKTALEAKLATAADEAESKSIKEKISAIEQQGEDAALAVDTQRKALEDLAAMSKKELSQYRSGGLANSSLMTGAAKTGQISVSVDQIVKTVAAVKNSKIYSQIPEFLAEFIDAIDMVPDSNPAQTLAQDPASIQPPDTTKAQGTDFKSFLSKIWNGSAKTGQISVSVDQIVKTVAAVKNSKIYSQIPEFLAEFIDAIDMVPDSELNQVPQLAQDGENKTAFSFDGFKKWLSSIFQQDAFTKIASIGRNESNLWLISHNRVSRKHAELSFNQDKELFITDLSSTYGTHVNGVRIPTQKKYLIKENDKVILGKFNDGVAFKVVKAADGKLSLEPVVAGSVADNNLRLEKAISGLVKIDAELKTLAIVDLNLDQILEKLDDLKKIQQTIQVVDVSKNSEISLVSSLLKNLNDAEINLEKLIAETQGQAIAYEALSGEVSVFDENAEWTTTEIVKELAALENKIAITLEKKELAKAKHDAVSKLGAEEDGELAKQIDDAPLVSDVQKIIADRFAIYSDLEKQLELIGIKYILDIRNESIYKQASEQLVNTIALLQDLQEQSGIEYFSYVGDLKNPSSISITRLDDDFYEFDESFIVEAKKIIAEKEQELADQKKVTAFVARISPVLSRLNRLNQAGALGAMNLEQVSENLRLISNAADFFKRFSITEGKTLEKILALAESLTATRKNIVALRKEVRNLNSKHFRISGQDFKYDLDVNEDGLREQIAQLKELIANNQGESLLSDVDYNLFIVAQNNLALGNLTTKQIADLSAATKLPLDTYERDEFNEKIYDVLLDFGYRKDLVQIIANLEEVIPGSDNDPRVSIEINEDSFTGKSFGILNPLELINNINSYIGKLSGQSGSTEVVGDGAVVQTESTQSLENASALISELSKDNYMATLTVAQLGDQLLEINEVVKSLSKIKSTESEKLILDLKKWTEKLEKYREGLFDLRSQLDFVIGEYNKLYDQKIFLDYSQLKLSDLVANAIYIKALTYAKENQSTSSSQDSVEGLKLPNKDLSILSSLLNKYSSGGAACVPTSYAYLSILKDGSVSSSAQENTYQQVLAKWKQTYGSSWAEINFFTKNDANEFPGKIQSRISATKIPAINNLLTILTAQNGENLESSSFTDQTQASYEVKKSNSAAVIFETEVSLPAKIVYVAKDNPHWNDEIIKKDLEKYGFPKVGDRAFTASHHALLAVDYRLDENDKYLIYFIDPMTGNILEISQDDLVSVYKEGSFALGTAAINGYSDAKSSSLESDFSRVREAVDYNQFNQEELDERKAIASGLGAKASERLQWNEDSFESFAKVSAWINQRQRDWQEVARHFQISGYDEVKDLQDSGQVLSLAEKISEKLSAAENSVSSGTILMAFNKGRLSSLLKIVKNKKIEMNLDGKSVADDKCSSCSTINAAVKSGVETARSLWRESQDFSTQAKIAANETDIAALIKQSKLKKKVALRKVSDIRNQVINDHGFQNQPLQRFLRAFINTEEALILQTLEHTDNAIISVEAAAELIDRTLIAGEMEILTTNQFGVVERTEAIELDEDVVSDLEKMKAELAGFSTSLKKLKEDIFASGAKSSLVNRVEVLAVEAYQTIKTLEISETDAEDAFFILRAEEFLSKLELPNFISSLSLDEIQKINIRIANVLRSLSEIGFKDKNFFQRLNAIQSAITTALDGISQKPGFSSNIADDKFLLDWSIRHQDQLIEKLESALADSISNHGDINELEKKAIDELSVNATPFETLEFVGSLNRKNESVVIDDVLIPGEDDTAILKNLQISINGVELQNIGSGAYRTVYKIKRDGKEYALKISFGKEYSEIAEAWSDILTINDLKSRADWDESLNKHLPVIVSYGATQLIDKDSNKVIPVHYELVEMLDPEKIEEDKLTSNLELASQLQEFLGAVDIDQSKNWGYRKDGTPVALDVKNFYTSNLARYQYHLRSRLKDEKYRKNLLMSDNQIIKTLTRSKRVVEDLNPKLFSNLKIEEIDPIVLEREEFLLEDDFDRILNNEVSIEEVIDLIDSVKTDELNNPYKPLFANLDEAANLLDSSSDKFQYTYVKPEELHVYAGMQYKATADDSIVNKPIQSDEWDQILSGYIDVWKNPADGLLYVVNGHHRYELMSRLINQGIKIDQVRIRYLDKETVIKLGFSSLLEDGEVTAEVARKVGAFLNLREARGTKQDTLKFILEQKLERSDLVALGLDVDSDYINFALQIKKLDPQIIDYVITLSDYDKNGNFVLENRLIMESLAKIGEFVSISADQLKFFEKIKNNTDRIAANVDLSKFWIPLYLNFGSSIFDNYDRYNDIYQKNSILSFDHDSSGGYGWTSTHIAIIRSYLSSFYSDEEINSYLGSFVGKDKLNNTYLIQERVLDHLFVSKDGRLIDGLEKLENKKQNMGKSMFMYELIDIVKEMMADDMKEYLVSLEATQTDFNQSCSDCTVVRADTKAGVDKADALWAEAQALTAKATAAKVANDQYQFNYLTKQSAAKKAAALQQLSDTRTQVAYDHGRENHCVQNYIEAWVDTREAIIRDSLADTNSAINAVRIATASILKTLADDFMTTTNGTIVNIDAHDVGELQDMKADLKSWADFGDDHNNLTTEPTAGQLKDLRDKQLKTNSREYLPDTLRVQAREMYASFRKDLLTDASQSVNLDNFLAAVNPLLASLEIDGAVGMMPLAELNSNLQKLTKGLEDLESAGLDQDNVLDKIYAFGDSLQKRKEYMGSLKRKAATLEAQYFIKTNEKFNLGNLNQSSASNLIMKIDQLEGLLKDGSAATINSLPEIKPAISKKKFEPFKALGKSFNGLSGTGKAAAGAAAAAGTFAWFGLRSFARSNKVKNFFKSITSRKGKGVLTVLTAIVVGVMLWNLVTPSANQAPPVQERQQSAETAPAPEEQNLPEEEPVVQVPAIAEEPEVQKPAVVEPVNVEVSSENKNGKLVGYNFSEDSQDPSEEDLINYDAAFKTIEPFSEYLQADEFRLIKQDPGTIPPNDSLYAQAGNDIVNGKWVASVRFTSDYQSKGHLDSLLRSIGLGDRAAVAALVHELTHLMKYEKSADGKYVESRFLLDFIQYFHHGDGLSESMPTDYPSRSGANIAEEDFADSVTLYLIAPEYLKKVAPLRFAFIENALQGRDLLANLPAINSNASAEVANKVQSSPVAAIQPVSNQLISYELDTALPSRYNVADPFAKYKIDDDDKVVFTERDEWNPINHEILPAYGQNRNAADYSRTISWPQVEVSKRYRRTADTTFCNIFAFDVMAAAGVPIPRWINGEKVNATGALNWLRTDTAKSLGWSEELTAEEAQAQANLGIPTVVVTEGHIAVVRPEENGKEGIYVGGVFYPRIAQAGRFNFENSTVYEGFSGMDSSQTVHYFSNASHYQFTQPASSPSFSIIAFLPASGFAAQSVGISAIQSLFSYIASTPFVAVIPYIDTTLIHNVYSWLNNVHLLPRYVNQFFGSLSESINIYSRLLSLQSSPEDFLRNSKKPFEVSMESSILRTIKPNTWQRSVLQKLFKERYATQLRGLGDLRKKAEELLDNNSSTNLNELYVLFDKYQELYALPESYRNIVKDFFDNYQVQLSRSKAIKESFEGKDNELAMAIFGELPKQPFDVEFKDDFVLLMLSNEDYGDFIQDGSYAFTMLETNFYPVDWQQKFDGQFISKNGLFVIARQGFAGPEAIRHEKRHILHAALYGIPQMNSVEGIRSLAADEILAKFEEGTLNSEAIIKDLQVTLDNTKKGAYDFFIDAGIDDVQAKTQYNREVALAIHAYQNLLDKGFPHPAIRAMFEGEEISRWPRLADRLTEPYEVDKIYNLFSNFYANIFGKKMLYSIGSAPSSSLQTLPKFSGITSKHAAIYRTRNGGLMVKNLDKEAGVSVDMREVPFNEEVELQEGQFVYFGDIDNHDGFLWFVVKDESGELNLDADSNYLVNKK